LNRPLLILGAFLAIASSARAAALPPPIAQASNGQIQCYGPNVARKTCDSMAAYRFGANGVIENAVLVLIAKNPVITMKTVSLVQVRGRQVCGAMSPRDIASATLTLNGQVLDAKQSATLRARIYNSMKGVFGRQICTAYIADGAALIAKATVDGAPQPAQSDQRVIWISERDGFSVSP